MKNLTKTQYTFLKKGRTMQEIAIKLFKGDYWSANHFQNTFINSGILEVFTKDIEVIISNERFYTEGLFIRVKK